MAYGYSSLSRSFLQALTAAIAAAAAAALLAAAAVRYIVTALPATPIESRKSHFVIETLAITKWNAGKSYQSSHSLLCLRPWISRQPPSALDGSGPAIAAL